MPQQTKAEISNELSKLTNTIDNLKKELRQKIETVQEQKRIIKKKAETINAESDYSNTEAGN